MTDTIPPPIPVAPPPLIAAPAAVKPTAVTVVTETMVPTALSTVKSTSTSTTTSPGWKTSEGILAAAATFLSLLFGAGIIPAKGPVQIAAVVIALALTSVGYSVSRGLSKGGAS